MIISRSKGVAFVHIPKCAGTSVRTLLRRFDDCEGEFWGVRADDDGTVLDWAHLPLDVLRDRRPRAFEDLCSVESFAIVRDPMDRFVSSMNEMLKLHHAGYVSRLDEAEISRFLEDVVATLGSATGPLPPKYVHFTPQIRYVSVDGSRVVGNLFAMGALDALQERLSEKVGLALPDVPRRNVRRNANGYVFRGRTIERMFWGARDAAQRRLPRPVFRLVRDVARPLVTAPHGKTGADRLREHPRTRSFVEAFYAEDFDLHAAVLRETERAGGRTEQPRT